MTDKDMLSALLTKQSEQLAAQADVLKEMQEQQKKTSIQLLNQAAEFSDFRNSQELYNFKMMNYLQDDPSSKNEGLVSKVSKIEVELSGIKSDLSKKYAVFSVGAVAIVTTIKYLVSKIFL